MSKGETIQGSLETSKSLDVPKVDKTNLQKSGIQQAKQRIDKIAEVRLSEVREECGDSGYDIASLLLSESIIDMNEIIPNFLDFLKSMGYQSLNKIASYIQNGGDAGKINAKLIKNIKKLYDKHMQTQENVEENQENIEEIQEKSESRIENIDKYSEAIKIIYEALEKSPEAKKELKEAMGKFDSKFDVNNPGDLEKFIRADVKNEKFVTEKIVPLISEQYREKFSLAIKTISEKKGPIDTADDKKKNIYETTQTSHVNKISAEAVKERIGVDGENISVQEKIDLMTDFFGKDTIDKMCDELLTDLFQNKEGLSDKSKQIVGKKDLISLSADQKKLVMINEGVFEKIYNENYAQISDYLSGGVAEKLINKRGEYISLYTRECMGKSLDTSNILLLPNGDIYFEEKSLVSGGITSNNMKFEGNKFMQRQLVNSTGSGNFASSYTEVCEIQPFAAFENKVANINLSELGTIKGKDDLNNKLDVYINSQLDQFMHLPIGLADNIKKNTGNNECGKAIAGLHFPESERNNLYEGKEITDEKNKEFALLLSTVDFTVEKYGSNETLSIINDGLINDMIKESFYKGGLSPFELLDKLGLIGIQDGRRFVDVEKLAKFKQILSGDEESSKQALKEKLGLDVTNGFDLVKDTNGSYYFKSDKPQA